jgi:hypothetical protein
MSDAPRPPVASALSLKVKAADEHMVRRLGQAVVLQWEELSDAMQDLLIDQAVLVGDPTPATQGEIETFIRTVKSEANGN